MSSDILAVLQPETHPASMRAEAPRMRADSHASRLRASMRAAAGAFAQHWAITARPAEALYVGCTQVAAVSVMAWLARLGGRSDVITAIAFGVVLMVIW